MIKEKTKKDRNIKLRIASLGGLGEVGKNMTVIEYGDDIVVIDRRRAYPYLGSPYRNL